MSTFAEFLHAFIENNAAANTTPLPLMGPSGAQVWTTAGAPPIITGSPRWIKSPSPMCPMGLCSLGDNPARGTVLRRHPRREFLEWHPMKCSRPQRTADLNMPCEGSASVRLQVERGWAGGILVTLPMIERSARVANGVLNYAEGGGMARQWCCSMA